MSMDSDPLEENGSTSVSPGNSAEGPLGMLPKRSFGLKLLLVCALALLMAIPALFVFTVVFDRSDRAENATREVSARYGGRQTAMGPVLQLPYTELIVETDNDGDEKIVERQGRVLLYPETGSVTADVQTELKKSGIHDVPVYAANVDFDAVFKPSRLITALPTNAEPDWKRARLIVGMSDSRAAREATTLTVDGLAQVLEPIGSVRSNSRYDYNSSNVTRLGAVLNGLESYEGEMRVQSVMSFSGAQSISFSPFARQTEVKLTSDWDDPKFSGGFQYSEYNNPADEIGFTANWSIPYEARGIPGVGSDLSANEMFSEQNLVKIDLVQNATPYQSVQRALKYALMFIGFVFLAYFLFEITSQQKAHPAQYVLVGLAQSVFYLLLLAMAEQFGFDLAFLTAASMTVFLTSTYAMSVFKNRKFGIRAFGVFAGVYILMYVLMRLEDFALLVGAFSSFAAIGCTMFMTRNIDWYGMQADLKAK